MERDELRNHLKATAVRDGDQGRRLTASIAAACWPGGPEDRLEPVALDWLRRWRPCGPATLLPVCTCGTGRCRVCN